VVESRPITTKTNLGFYNLDRVEFIKEKVSGNVPWRQRKIGPLLRLMKRGDVILLSEFSRLGRSMLECIEIISLAVDKGIRIYTVKGGLI